MTGFPWFVLYSSVACCGTPPVKASALPQNFGVQRVRSVCFQNTDGLTQPVYARPAYSGARLTRFVPTALLLDASSVESSHLALLHDLRSIATVPKQTQTC